VQAKVEDTLSDGILSGQFKDGDTVHIEVKDGEIVLTPGNEAPPEPEAQGTALPAG
jgi:ATP-dependent Clp protease ATP-binding subunit ClpA